LLVITLRAPALMLDPRQLVDQDGCPVAEATVVDLYTKYWHEASDDKLTLLRRFTTHRLIGGYLANRYRRFLDQSPRTPAEQRRQPYNPALVTEAGSVFVLRRVGHEQEITRLITRWLERGLPIPAWASLAYGDSYLTNPFLPAHGYGEVAVNSPLHERFQPLKTEQGR
jgi:hypothetical protein